MPLYMFDQTADDQVHWRHYSILSLLARPLKLKGFVYVIGHTARASFSCIPFACSGRPHLP